MQFIKGEYSLCNLGVKGLVNFMQGIQYVVMVEVMPLMMIIIIAVVMIIFYSY